MNVAPPPPRGGYQPQQAKSLRWILFGFAMGAASTALIHHISIHMPSIRIELEYADAPHDLNLQQQHRNLPQFGQASLQFSKSKMRPPPQKEDFENAEEENEENTEEETEANENQDQDQEEEEEAEGAPKDKEEKMQFIEAEFVPSEDTPDFSDPGPPPKLDPGDAFAACILIKDDNHWLIEWLAYHYHTMPLRYLIVAIDPGSKTSPIPILKRWKERKLMTIGIWGDDMFMPKQIKANPKSFDNNTELMMHRVRQNNFYFKCMRTFRQRNREWLMLIDTDEYIVTNYASGQYYNITRQIPITKPGNVLRFIKHHHQLTGQNHTCSYMPRYMFGIKESSNEMVQRHVGQRVTGMDGRDFMTQRFMYRNPRRMHNGKNLINLFKLPEIKMYTSVHHVSSYCPDPDKMRTVNHVKNSLVRIHHYLGTEEQYFFRTDPRGGKKEKVSNSTAPHMIAAQSKPKKTNHAYFTRGENRYNNLNKNSNYPDQGARAWLKGFVDDVGVETAIALLKGVGQTGYEGEEDELAKEEASKQQAQQQA